MSEATNEFDAKASHELLSSDIVLSDGELGMVLGGGTNISDVSEDEKPGHGSPTPYTPPPPQAPPGAGSFPPGTPGILQPGNNIGQSMNQHVQDISWTDAARHAAAEFVEYGAGKLPPVADYVGGKIAEWIRPDDD